MIRESPTLASARRHRESRKVHGLYRGRSAASLTSSPRSAWMAARNWSPAQGPAHVELVCDAPPIPKPSPNLPPLDGQYISPQKWHALYAQGIIISKRQPQPLHAKRQAASSSGRDADPHVQLGHRHDDLDEQRSNRGAIVHAASPRLQVARGPVRKMKAPLASSRPKCWRSTISGRHSARRRHGPRKSLQGLR